MKLRQVGTVCFLIILCSFYALGQCSLNPTSPSVTICSPASGATLASPIRVVAGTTDSQPVTLLQIYVDGSKAYQISGSSLDTSLSLNSGSHRLTAHAGAACRQRPERIGQGVKDEEAWRQGRAACGCGR